MDLSLFLLCSLAGLVMVAGSLFLLWKGRIYLDTEGKNVSEVELPMGIKFKTQFPVLVMFLFGAFMLSFPIFKHPRLCPNLSFHKHQPLEWVELKGKVEGEGQVMVVAIADSWRADATKGVDLKVPYIQNHTYIIKYTDAEGYTLHEEYCRADHKRCELSGFRLQGNHAPVPTGARGQLISANTVNEFNKPTNSVAEAK